MIPIDPGPARPSRLRERLRYRNWHIANKLLVVILGLSLVPLVLATLLSARLSAQALAGQTRISLTRLAYGVALRVTGAIADTHQTMQMVTTDPEVAAYLAAPPGSRPAALQSDLAAAVRNLLAATPRLDVVGIYDRTGTTIAHSDPATVGRNVASRDFVAAALAGQSFTSSFRRDAVNDSLGVSIAEPVREGSTVVGAVAVHLRGSAIEQILTDTLRIEGGGLSAREMDTIDVWLIDGHGIVMSRPASAGWVNRALGSAPWQEGDFAAAPPLGLQCPGGAASCPSNQKTPRQPQAIPAVQALSDEIQAAFQAGRSGSYRYCSPASLDAPAAAGSCRGTWHILGYAPVANPTAGTGEQASLLMVAVDLPEDAFMGAVRQQQLSGVAIAAAMALLAVAASLAVARRLSQPVRTLAQTATEVEQDRPFEPASLGRVLAMGDEIGHLARVFSSMVIALRKRMAELRTIYEVGRVITSSVDLDQTLAFVLDAVRQAVPYDGAEICLYDPLEHKLVARAAADRQATRQFERTYGDDEPLSAGLIAAQAGVLVTDLGETGGSEPGGSDPGGARPRPERTWDAAGPAAYLGVPLRVGGDVIGTLELVSASRAGFDEGDLRVLESIAVQAAGAIRNAQDVLARESRLQQEIKTLNIEIDEFRREKQVKEIVDTEYFQRLRDQAAQLRGARTAEEEEG